LLSTANDALEEPEDPEPAVDEEVPVPVAPVPVPALLDVALLLVLLLLVEAFVVPVAETVSPISPESATIVPSSGA
jgi:hypothetical protein